MWLGRTQCENLQTKRKSSSFKFWNTSKKIIYLLSLNRLYISIQVLFARKEKGKTKKDKDA